MDFGLFLLSPQLDPRKDAAMVLRDTIELAVAAEDLGYGAVWVSEHHFANLSLSPSPLLTLSHIAARTRRIRLGTGVLVLPLHHPMRLAEEIAYVDHLCEGRLNIGVGGGSQVHESRGLETSLEESHARFLESLDILQMAFDEGAVEYQGQHYRIPATPMSIRPRQQPHPPIFVAGMSGDAEVTRRIAERGYTAFASLFGPPDGEPRRKREEVLQAFDAARVARETMRYAGQRVVYVTDDPADARDAAEQVLLTLRAVSALKGGSARFDGHVVQLERSPQEPDPQTALNQLMIGDAEKVAHMIEEDRRHLKPDHFSTFMHFGGLDRRRIVRSMERFMGEVVPMLQSPPHVGAV